MSSGILLKGVFVAIMSGALSWVVLDRYGTENGSENSNWHGFCFLCGWQASLRYSDDK